MSSAVAAERVRLAPIDAIKAAAIVAVVFTHAGPFLFGPGATPYDLTLRASWTRFHVPSFLIVSGFLYCRSTGVTPGHVWGRLQRVLVPYAIASAVVQLVGLSGAATAAEVAFDLATGSSLGIYYFVFLLAICIVLIWPLSRLHAGAIGALAAALLVYTVAKLFDPRLAVTRSWFWMSRNAVDFFYLGFFLLGWLGALWLPRLRALHDRWPSVLWSASALGLLTWVGVRTGLLPRTVQGVAVIVYTLGVVGTITLLSRGRRLYRPLRFLSEASLTIYLYHRIFIQLALPHTLEWNPLVRILGLVALGLGTSTLLCLLGRRLLGMRWSRTLLGA